jgi:hypothetical protein
MRKFAFAMVVVVVSFSYVMAEEFLGNITKVDGSKITYTKFGGKKGGKADPMTADATKDVKVMKGEGNFDKDAMKFVVKEGDKIDKGLADDTFKNASDEKGKGVLAQITIADDGDNKGKITKIVVLPGFGGKKGKGGGGQ